MLKKVIPIVLMLCLLFSISVMAENENPISEENVPEVSQQIPQDAEELPQGEESNTGMPPSGDMQGRTPPNMPNGEMPPEGMNRGQRPQRNFTPPQNAGEFTPPQNTDATNTEATAPQTKSNESSENSQVPGGNHQFGGQMPGGMGGFPDNMQNFNEQTHEEVPMAFLGFVKTYSTPITSVILLALAFVFVIFYRRKNY